MPAAAKTAVLKNSAGSPITPPAAAAVPSGADACAFGGLGVWAGKRIMVVPKSGSFSIAACVSGSAVEKLLPPLSTQTAVHKCLVYPVVPTFLEGVTIKIAIIVFIGIQNKQRGQPPMELPPPPILQCRCLFG